MKKDLIQILVVSSFILVFAIQALAHCEIPCGIYDDEFQMLIYSMKCKQATDLNHVNILRSLVTDFQALYFEKK